LLHYWDNLKVREIAVVLNMKEGTIQSRLKRDRERIRHMMEQGDVALHKPQGQETAQVAPGSSIDDVEFDVRGENDE
jgi:IS30 family transposase